MMRLNFILVLFFALVFICTNGSKASFLDNVPLISTSIEGYVLKIHGTQKNILTINSDITLDREGLFNATLPSDRIIEPLDASISIGDTLVQTDKHGYFMINKSLFGLSKEKITIAFKNAGGTLSILAKKEGAAFFNIFIVNKDGRMNIYRLKEDSPTPNKNAVFFVHGSRFSDFFYITEENNISTWDMAINLMKNDYELTGFEFYKFNYNSSRDIVRSSINLSSAIQRYRKIVKNKPIILAGYGLGGLIVRHFTVSENYINNSVGEIILVGTPNHGYSFLLNKDQESSRQAMKGSGLLDVLSGVSNSNITQRYFINTKLQGDNGLNNDIKTVVVGGNITSKIKKSMKSASTETTDFMINFVFKLKELFINAEETFYDVVKFLKRFKYTTVKEIENLPDGDLIVSLESTRINNIDPIIIEYPHSKLLEATDDKDVRYMILKDILLDRRN